MTRFRNPVQRDIAWGRYYAKRGLRPLITEPRSQPVEFRLADYIVRKAMHEARSMLSRVTVRC